MPFFMCVENVVLVSQIIEIEVQGIIQKMGEERNTLISEKTCIGNFLCLDKRIYWERKERLNF